ncbi:MAG: hypothetical protein JWL58_7366 [Streptosporangiaceae bacterium]|nr:hypothetical protein [Streptosporangiaceae bacterium]
MSAQPRYTERLEIKQLLAVFTHVFDNGEIDDLDLVFTKDAVIELTRGAGRKIVGLDSIAEFVVSLRGQAPDHHTLDTAFFPGHEGTVRARSRYLAVLPDGSVHNGDFLDVLHLTSDGWRIAHRISVPRYPAGEQVRLPDGLLAAWRPDKGR